MNLIDFKCPACGAPIHCSRAQAMVQCEYCDTKIMVDDIRLYHEDAAIERHRITEEEETLREIHRSTLSAQQKDDMLAIIMLVPTVIIALIALYILR